MDESDLLAALKAAESELILAKDRMASARTEHMTLDALAEIRDRVAIAELKVVKATARYVRDAAASPGGRMNVPR